MRDARREDVRAFLFHERRLASFGLGLLVRGARLATLFDLSLDPPLSDFHLEMIDRRFFGQRKDVDAFLPFGRRIGETLGHRCARGHPAHCDVDIGEEERGRDRRLA